MRPTYINYLTERSCIGCKKKWVGYFYVIWWGKIKNYFSSPELFDWSIYGDLGPIKGEAHVLQAAVVFTCKQLLSCVYLLKPLHI